jgi:hypothetical protein
MLIAASQPVKQSAKMSEMQKSWQLHDALAISHWISTTYK